LVGYEVDGLGYAGTLHHGTVRGIEARRIINDVADRKKFNSIKKADAKIKYQLPVKEQDQKIDEFIIKRAGPVNRSIQSTTSPISLPLPHL
jgi:hypothetical protein